MVASWHLGKTGDGGLTLDTEPSREQPQPSQDPCPTVTPNKVSAPSSGDSGGCEGDREPP